MIKGKVCVNSISQFSNFENLKNYLIEFMIGSPNPDEKYIIPLTRLHGDDKPHECGYCQQEGSYTCGLSIKKMKSATYKELMDSGWRRCGSYFYHPSNEKNCCQMFTIRMDVETYELKKSHQQIWQKFNNIIYGNDDPMVHIESEQKIEAQKGKKQEFKKDFGNKETDKQKDKMKDEQPNTSSDLGECDAILVFLIEKTKTLQRDEIMIILKTIEELDQAHWSLFKFDAEEIVKDIKVFPSNIKKKGDYFSNFVSLIHGQNQQAFQKVKIDKFVDVVQEFLYAHFGNNDLFSFDINERGNLSFFLKKDNQIISQPTNQQVNIEQIKAPKEIQIKEPKVHSEEFQKNEEFKKIQEQSEPIIKKEQNINQYNLKEREGDIVTGNLIKKGRLTIKIEQAASTPENFRLYSQYCDEIHKQKEKDEDSYQNFLCLTPLSEEQMTSKINPEIELKMGCYHMNYYLDDQLFAVGVVDIFYSVMSSVYFFYDPKFKKLSPGVYGALIEIEFIKEMKKSFPSFKYYYLGYYIDDCQKMNYKADYEPCELLCPVTYKWAQLDEKLKVQIQDKKQLRLMKEDVEIDPEMKFDNIKEYINQNTKISMQKMVAPFVNICMAFKADMMYKIFTPIAKSIQKSLYKTLWFDYT